VSAPVMMGKHGFSRTASEMTRAYKELAGPLAKAAKAGRITDEVLLDIAKKAGGEGMHDSIKALMDSGHISSQNNFDLTSWDSTYDKNTLSKVNDRISDVMGDVELLNRMTTAFAAIRLEQGRGNADGATAYAQKIIYDTHGDYSGFNAPAVMRTIPGRILGQFRKFQLIQIGMYGRLIKDAFFNANADERWVAQKALMYSFGSMGLWGGALGMPAMGTITYMLGAIFGDDDEPNDPETKMRQLIGNEGIANLLLRGVPAALGVDLSQRVGAGNLGNPLPFGKLALDRESMKDNLAAAMGPFVGTSINFLDGLSKIASGDGTGALQMLPKGAKDAVKGFNLMTDGIRLKNGDLAMSADEFGFFDGVLTGLGMPTTKSTNRQLAANASFEANTFYKDRTSSLKKDYVQAYKAGDTAKTMELRQEWAEMQAAKKARGYKVDPLSTLLKAPAAQKKREKDTAGGLQYRAREAGAVKQLAELY
jgi:hypothetical protein